MSRRTLENSKGIELVRIKREQSNQAPCFCSDRLYFVGCRCVDCPVRFRIAGEMLEVFGMHKGGKEYRRLVSAFEKISGATIFFGTDQVGATAKLVQRPRFNFLGEAQICYNRQSDQPAVSDDFENVIVLSDEFYREISEHPIPTDLNAVRVLSASPAVLDLSI